MEKILLFDIETMANKAYVWGKYDQNVISFDAHWYLLTFAYKWLGEKRVHAYALPDFKTFKKDKTNDRELVVKLWELFNEAQVVIAHNGDAFDIKKAQALFVKHKLTPPKPFKSIDTKKVAKRYFRFDSNKLDDLGEYLGLGRKIETGGFDLWLDCAVNNVSSAWKKMVDYNKQDVALLEDVYLTLRPWMSDHPNHNVYNDTVDQCPTCGGELKEMGYLPTRTSKHQLFQCNECGAWSKKTLVSSIVR